MRKAIADKSAMALFVYFLLFAFYAIHRAFRKNMLAFLMNFMYTIEAVYGEWAPCDAAV